MTIEPGETSFEVSDLALAKLAAQAAVSVPGVLRLAPRLAKVVQGALTRVARSLTSSTPSEPGPADPGAVEVERSDAGPTTVTVRIVATGEPSVLETVDAVSGAVHRALLQSAVGVEVEVVVVVVDTEPGR